MYLDVKDLLLGQNVSLPPTAAISDAENHSYCTAALWAEPEPSLPVWLMAAVDPKPPNIIQTDRA